MHDFTGGGLDFWMRHYSDIAFAVLGLAKRWKNFGNDAEGKMKGG
ncbi:MAG: hypothetical protein Q8J90_06845 [Gallionella sp.]|nr:hypothetical protein [Gallionella sp.]